MGDWYEEPAGTYYWRNTPMEEAYWHILDQILIRPALLPYFENTDSIKIITKMDDVSLLTKNGLPDETKFSDHLPIQFSINI